MSEEIQNRCVTIFREVSGLNYSEKWHSISDAELLSKPMISFEVDSLTMIEYVMKVEDDFKVELDEDEVNKSRNIMDIARLVEEACRD